MIKIISTQTHNKMKDEIKLLKAQLEYEKNNSKKIKDKNKELEKENKDLNLRFQVSERNNNQKENIIKILDKNLKKAKEDVCKYRIALEDAQGFLKQEKQAKEQLIQNNKPKRKPTKKKEVQNDKQN